MEVKLYAFGHKDGTWARSRRDKWERIAEKSSNRQHAALARDYFCLNSVVAGSEADMLDRLRWKRPLTREHSN